jgi:hypothetical protein
MHADKEKVITIHTRNESFRFDCQPAEEKTQLAKNWPVLCVAERRRVDSTEKSPTTGIEDVWLLPEYSNDLIVNSWTLEDDLA